MVKSAYCFCRGAEFGPGFGSSIYNSSSKGFHSLLASEGTGTCSYVPTKTHTHTYKINNFKVLNEIDNR